MPAFAGMTSFRRRPESGISTKDIEKLFFTLYTEILSVANSSLNSGIDIFAASAILDRNSADFSRKIATHKLRYDARKNRNRAGGRIPHHG